MSEPRIPRHLISRRTLLAAAGAAPLAALLAPASAQAAVTFQGKIVDEPTPFAARLPDILKLPDGRVMAVWYRAESHFGPGVIRLSFSSDASATGWSTPHNALFETGDVGTLDQRDPKLGLMNDGSVILTFFTPDPYRVWYSVWKPGANYFIKPKLFTAAGMPGMLEHGSAIALANSGSHVNEVLVPVYYGGAWYVRAKWDAANWALTAIEPARQILADTPTRTVSEPSFVQVGDWMVAVLRCEVPGSTDPSGTLPAQHVWWRAYDSAPTFYFQTLNTVKSSSHHLLKTSSGQVLLTFGDGNVTHRPTKGVLISNPQDVWSLDTPISIYNSGVDDQANPSSIELTPGTFLTTGYNADPNSAYFGTLWLLKSSTADY